MHPADGPPHHELLFMCDNVGAFVPALGARGAGLQARRGRGKGVRFSWSKVRGDQNFGGRGRHNRQRGLRRVGPGRTQRARGLHGCQMNTMAHENAILCFSEHSDPPPGEELTTALWGRRL